MAALRFLFMNMFLSLIFAGFSHAQPEVPALDDQLDTFASKYALTETQKAAVRPIMQTNRDNLKPLFKQLKKAKSKREKLSALRAIDKEQTRYKKELSTILNKNQMKKYEQTVQSRREKLKQFRKTE